MALTRPRYSQIYDTDYKQSVRLATTSDVGNLSAGGGNITNTVDGITVIANDRILVKDQDNADQNGIYRVVTVGTGSDGTWERALDSNANDKVTSGMTTVITAGATHSGTTWKLTTADPIILGTTELTFINPFDQSVISDGGGMTVTVDGEYANIEAPSGNLIASFSDDRIQHGHNTYRQKQYILHGITEDASETELFINGKSSNRIPVTSATTILYDVDIVTRRTDATGVSASWHLKGCADNFSGTVADVGDIYEIVVARDDANLLADCRANDTTNSLNVYVTGISGQTFRWTAVVRTIEVSE